MSVYDVIAANPNPPALAVGWVNESALRERIHRIEQGSRPLKDEQVLTYLCAYGYAIAPGGPEQLARLLLENENLDYPGGKLWFEFLPMSPRNGEGEPHLDLLLGHLRKRNGTLSGIEFAPPAEMPSWVACVEAKVKCDISCQVTYDVFRNQLLRVVENGTEKQRKDISVLNEDEVVERRCI